MHTFISIHNLTCSSYQKGFEHLRRKSTRHKQHNVMKINCLHADFETAWLKQLIRGFKNTALKL